MWACTHCGKPVELVPPGAWWRHVNPSDVEACGIRLSDDAYNTDTERFYINDDEEDDVAEPTYKIIRFRFNEENEVLVRGLTLEQAQEHCRRDDTHGDGWFDGYEEES